MGEYLQTFNVAVLRRIEVGRWCAADWDTALVRLEQVAVERLLTQLEQADRQRHANVTRQLDRFLYCLARRIGGSGYGPCTVVLSSGLREIQVASARAVRFNSLSDRVTVGTTLIRILRHTKWEPRTEGRDEGRAADENHLPGGFGLNFTSSLMQWCRRLFGIAIQLTPETWIRRFRARTSRRCSPPTTLELDRSRRERRVIWK
jgi:hypothetical protein